LDLFVESSATNPIEEPFVCPCASSFLFGGHGGNYQNQVQWTRAAEDQIGVGTRHNSAVDIRAASDHSGSKDKRNRCRSSNGFGKAYIRGIDSAEGGSTPRCNVIRNDHRWL
jgi:hypothetical protein